MASKRKPFNKSTGRRYGPGTTDGRHNKANTANRSKRNQARRIMKDKLTAKFGAARAASMMKGKHVGHIRPLSKGGTNSPSNLKLQSAKKNLGTDRPTGKRKKR